MLPIETSLSETEKSAMLVFVFKILHLFNMYDLDDDQTAFIIDWLYINKSDYAKTKVSKKRKPKL